MCPQNGSIKKINKIDAHKCMWFPSLWPSIASSDMGEMKISSTVRRYWAHAKVIYRQQDFPENNTKERKLIRNFTFLTFQHCSIRQGKMLKV